MSVDRPTFSESWYRVCELRPRLRSTIQIHRQHFRGQTWHVVQDPANNQFFRLNAAAYHFVAMLDGQRSVSEVWNLCNEELGDSAPTQGEAIQLLGQLYASNLLAAELPPDSEGLFQRYRKRVTREVQSYLMNLLFIRIPLFDPDRLLDRWIGAVGWIFSPIGLVLLVALMGVGSYYLVSNWGELVDQTRTLTSQQYLTEITNLGMLYLVVVITKILHEFGHAFACKKFGKASGSGGEVHVMGVMFLIFTPLPYVDASSAWALRSKWHRAVVGLAGMLVELGLAAIAAIIWATTAEQSQVHRLAHQVMVMASISTVLFNINPLLRYDGYYILSDLLEIPNLAQRAKDYVYYLVRKYAWGVRNVRNPATTGGEKAWFIFYGIASTIYRVVICVGILLFVAGRFFQLGLVLAVAAGIAWVLVPLGKFLHYLFTSAELLRVRGRAIGSTLGVVAALGAIIGAAPFSDNRCIDGLAEARQMSFIFTGADGFIEGPHVPSGQSVQPDQEQPLVQGRNMELETRLKALAAERAQLESQRRMAQTQEPAEARNLLRAIAFRDRQMEQTRKDLAALRVKPPLAGTWIAPEIDRLPGAFLPRGKPLGMVADLDDMIVRVVAGQDVASLLIEELDCRQSPRVRIRLRKRPDVEFTGRVERILPAGQEQLFSPAMGLSAGGAVETDVQDRQGVKTRQNFFEIRIRPDTVTTRSNEGWDARLLPNQRVIVRFELSRKTLYTQWRLKLLQLIEKRFRGQGQGQGQGGGKRR